VETAIEDAVRRALDGAESSATFDTQLAPPRLAVRESPPARPRAGDTQMALFVAGAPPDGAQVAADAQPAAALLDAGAGRPRLWQLLDTYVLAETRDGLLIVDQHSAHERILFQRLMDAFEAGGQHGQRLLFPLTLRLTAPEVACMADLSGMLERVGFEVERRPARPRAGASEPPRAIPARGSSGRGRLIGSYYNTERPACIRSDYLQIGLPAGDGDQVPVIVGQHHRMDDVIARVEQGRRVHRLLALGVVDRDRDPRLRRVDDLDEHRGDGALLQRDRLGLLLLELAGRLGTQ
jgi:hypothetical protein